MQKKFRKIILLGMIVVFIFCVFNTTKNDKSISFFKTENSFENSISKESQAKNNKKINVKGIEIPNIFNLLSYLIQ